MSIFPERSVLPTEKVLYRPHKKGNGDFFDYLSLSTEQKQTLREQIRELTFTHQLDEQTTNIPKGKQVDKLAVLKVHLVGDQLDLELLRQLDQRIGMYLIFDLRRADGSQSYLINYKEPIAKSKNDGILYRLIRTFETDESINLDLGVANLDHFYGQLVKEVSTETLIKESNQDISSAIAREQDITRLEKRASQLAKKIAREKSVRQQFELRKDHRQLLATIQQLKQGN